MITDEITPDLLLKAYASGIFPMAPDAGSEELTWYLPEERGIMPLGGMHVSKKLLKLVMSGRLTVTADRAFDDVMLACAEPAPGRETTWISGRIRALYGELHRRGNARSIEVWNGGTLAGGLYGVCLRGAFFGESMFSRERDASKVALVHLVAGLRKGGYTLLDTQYTTPHLTGLGGIGIPAADYQSLLHQALTVRAVWPEDFSLPALRDFIASLRAPAGDPP
ncbi:leucyl/phenylalanyl-tRNA--protein transferase [Gluconobacter kanchanaburiensis]|uniref:Leucyl/phenylalanyl-tRNA--protein transferase n=1 Tax=Gluconobacter kanchanaburiensis NBRC 103587 TaxID=1307948 RepID=A0A511B365_9PROT|nr:leucyl/phenylalanyl-tRNA--protein transferase [Gluconobacter kanchanaburiensis]MBF0860962.1 leucyl/phenylalanyl-tRNA--protein transferase [Gluconobacter kanchanaburiensis]GEK94858.1 leucyl/phenylalanyl-tRNA--protein transferase [Gluconobacter kanchanaburiensis NBRC 103587]